MRQAFRLLLCYFAAVYVVLVLVFVLLKSLTGLISTPYSELIYGPAITVASWLVVFVVAAIVWPGSAKSQEGNGVPDTVEIPDAAEPQNPRMEADAATPSEGDAGETE